MSDEARSAYETLCAHPEWPVRTLITLGSPLGTRNLIFDRLEPTPTKGRGAWPGGLRHWTNVADTGDIVALEKDLRSLFGDDVEDRRVFNGPDAHSIRAYMTARETGEAVARELSTE